MPTRKGRYVIELSSKPVIASGAAVVGKTEGEGPLSDEFDFCYPSDNLPGTNTWEQCESALQKDAVKRALKKCGKNETDVDIFFAGDLLNQCIASTFGIRDMSIPFAGLFGACSTMALSLALAGVFADSYAANTVLAATSSHFCSAEKQFRFPLEYGGQRPPTAQRTVTGAGAAVITRGSRLPYIKQVMFGRIEDLGITDANNMGAAMAPAAARTIIDFLRDTNTRPVDYDMILTGDLGSVGSKLLIELLQTREKTDISEVHCDCGMLIYDTNNQDVHSGGSGCGCSGSVVCSYILRLLREKKLKKILFVGTGALMSPTSSQQNESIPGIAHAVVLCAAE